MTKEEINKKYESIIEISKNLREAGQALMQALNPTDAEEFYSGNSHNHEIPVEDLAITILQFRESKEDENSI